MDSTAFMLSRIQFGANITFHILFPTISIGLAWVLVALRVKHMRTGNAIWEQAHYFWTKVFALTFAMGVVTGITMSFQFGTNWPGFMQATGNISGPLLGYEVLTAFFLEAGFLGVMLFGRSKVSNRVHMLSTCMVAFGTTLSAFWIVSLNSWMQTPAGYSLVDGKFYADSWLAIVFNPSFPFRLGHVLLSSFLTVSFVIAGLSAWQMIKGKATAYTGKMMSAALVAAALMIPIQIFVGDMHGLNTLQHQPAKVAAMEAIWNTEKNVPLVLFAWPDTKTKSNLFSIEISSVASLILTHARDIAIRGLNEFEGAHPAVPPVFFAFRIMVGTGVMMLLMSWYSVLHFRLWSKSRKVLPKALLWSLVAMTFSGWVATVAGWYVTEMGRQPWIVYGLLKTQDVVAPHPASVLTLTVVAFFALYLGLIYAYIWVIKYMAESANQLEGK
jgi:cytochrome bd ubiquinol oxidase subunit I